MAPTTLLLQHIRHLAASPAADGQPDRELLQRFARDGDGQAFAALLRRHGPMVWGACRRVLPLADDAEDVFQATFLLLARKAALLRDQGAVGGWLYGVAYRLALRARSAEAVRTDRESRTPARAPADPLADITLRETQQLFDDALSRLPEKCRAVLVLCCLEGLTQDEAARQLGCSRSTLKRRLVEGRTRLRQLLVRRGLTLPAALLAAALAPRSGAALPPPLAAAVLRAAAGGSVAGRVARLAAHGAGPLLAGKIRGAIGFVLAIAITVVGAAGLAALRPDDRPPDEQAPPAPPPAARADDKPPARIDRFDDPLPDEALARIGTTRFRHGGHITSIAFTADGKRLLSCGWDGIRVWDAATGREQRYLAAELDTRFLAAAFSADCKLAATTQYEEGGSLKDAPVILWDLTTGKKVKELGKAMYGIVQFSPDGKLLAAARYDNAVETWDVAAGKQLASWQAHEGDNRAPSLAFTADGKTLMTGGIDRAVCFWDVVTGKKLRGFDGIVNQTRSLALSADGKVIASIEHTPSPPRVIGGETSMQRVRILDAADGKVLRQVEVPATKLAFGQVNAVRCVALSRDGKTLAGAGAENTVHLWDLATGKELAHFAAFGPADMAFAPDGKTLAVATWGNAVRLYDVASGKELPRGAGLEQPAFSVGLTPDGRTLATTGGKSSILLWDPATGEQRRRLDGHEGLVASLRLSADGRTLVSAGGDGTVRLWDVATGRQLRKFAGEQLGELPQLMACSPDGKLLAVQAWSANGSPLRLIDALTGERVREITLSNPAVHGAAFLPDGRSLVVWTGDRKARVWDVTTGKTTREVEYTEAVRTRPGPVSVAGSPEVSYFAAAVSPDGRRIAFGSENDLLAVHELAGGAEVCRVEKLSRGVGCLAFSPDGRTLAWGSPVDPTVHLLEVATGKERRAFAGHRGGVVSLTFSADGRTIVSGGNDTTLLVWDLTGRGRAPSADESSALWKELLGDDAPRADRAVRRLAASPKSAVELFRERIKPAAPADEKHVAGLIADLDSDDFSTREKAAAGLEKLGDLASAACRKALAGQPSAEARRPLEALLEKRAGEARKPSAERVRWLRALEVLELAATEEARRLLAELAKGAPGAWLTEEAKMATARLERPVRP